MYKDARLRTQFKQRKHDNYVWQETAAASKRVYLRNGIIRVQLDIERERERERETRIPDSNCFLATVRLISARGV